MTEQSLKFKLIWLSAGNQDNEVTSSSVLAVVKDFFKNFLALNCEQHEMQVGNVFRKHTSILYNELLFEIVCGITYSCLKHSLSTDALYSEICRQWCSEGRSKNELQWLMPLDHKGYVDKVQSQMTSLSEFGFGTLVGLTNFISHYKFGLSGKGYRDLSCYFDHGEKKIIIALYIKHNHTCPLTNNGFQKLEIPYSSILRILVNDVAGTHPTELYLLLDCPPLVYIRKKDGIDLVDSNIKTVTQWGFHSYERTTKLGCECSHSLCPKDIIGSCPVVNIVIPDKFRSHLVLGRLYQRHSGTELYYCHVKLMYHFKSVSRKLKTSLRSFEFHHGNKEEKFSCHYAWTTLLNRSYEVVDHIALEVADWMKLFAHCNRKNCTALEKTFYYIFKLMEKGQVVVFNRAVKYIFEEFDKLSLDNDLPPGVCLVRRLFVTPTRLLFLPPQPHFSNRILRNFNPNYVLRVSFRDDNLKKITYPFQYNSKRKEFIENIIGRVLREGVQIKDRHYQFLGASNSQLRDHGVWMYAKDTLGETSSSIRLWMGDFSNINNIAKLVARMGQCFSTSEEAVEINVKPDNVKLISDIIVRENNQDYNFSDGIGMISKKLANEIYKLLFEKLKNKNLEWETFYKPSAFQIRYAGSKGMVVIAPFLVGYKMAVRNSMMKFECTTSEKLEIIKTSAPRPLYLNRPLITILEQMGIPKEVFFNLQQNMITKLTDALIYESHAENLLTNRITYGIPFKKLHEVGISLTEEPFFRSLLLSIYRKDIGNINSKTRISVPFQFGRNMLGALDESKTLKSGEIFVQYSEEIGIIASKLHILEGPVLVTRSPCMHPGDVRKLKAVDVPALHHIKDCVVFPAKGKRPHQDEMAGGDLDGDEYAVIWMPELLFCHENAHPMDYPHGIPDGVNKNVTFTVDDMIKFVCDYIEKDVIGLVAHSHLAHADQEHKGIFSPKCMKIAKLFPLILDFAKTGEFAFLNKKDRPKLYPDFMEKGGLNNSYHSDKVLGILYRSTKALKSVVSLGNLTLKEISHDHCLEFPGWEEYAQVAKIERDKYNEQINVVLQMYEMDNEVDIIYGNIQVGKYCQEKNDSANILSLVNAHFQQIYNKTRIKFIVDVEEESTCRGFSVEDAKIAKYRRASALYMVTYKEGPVQYLSFPWCIADILADVRKECLKIKQVITSCVLSSLEDKISRIILTEGKAFAVHKYSKDGLKACSEVHNIVTKVLQNWALECRLISVRNGELSICNSCFNQAFCLSLNQICPNYENKPYDAGSYKTSTSSRYEIKEGISCPCTVEKLILNFLKLYATYQNCNESVVCSNTDCLSLNMGNLQAVALSTYISIALTRNLSFLGIEVDTSEYFMDISKDEGDPVRISAENNVLQELIKEHTDEIEIFLKKMFGVQEIYIQGQEDRCGRKYIIINCTGKDWQRWKLQEFILHTSFLDILKKHIAECH